MSTDEDVKKCRANGWGPGTRLVGDEGLGPTVIRITYVSDYTILAIEESHNEVPAKYIREHRWTLMCRDWQVAPAALSEPSPVGEGS